MAAMRAEERARLAALREFELARLVGDGDIDAGLMRLRIADRRAYRRVPPLPARAQQQEAEESAAQQATGGSSRRRGRRGGASRRRTADGDALPGPEAQRQDEGSDTAAVAPQPGQPQQQPQQQQQPTGLLLAAPMPHESEALPVPQASAQIVATAMTIEARDKRLLSPPKPAPATADSPPASQQPAPKRQLLPPSSLPPSAPPSPPSVSPLLSKSPPSTPPRSKPPSVTKFLPRPLAIRKLNSPPFTPTKPQPQPSTPTTEAQSTTALAAPFTPIRVRPRRLELGDSPSTGSPAPVPPSPPSDAKHTGGQTETGDAKQPEYNSSAPVKGEEWNSIVTRYYCFDCISDDSEWLRKEPCLKPGHSNQETHTHPRICFHTNHDVYDCEACLSGHRSHCLTCQRAPVEPRYAYHSSSDSDSDRYCDFRSDSECCDLSFLDD